MLSFWKVNNIFVTKAIMEMKRLFSFLWCARQCGTSILTASGITSRNEVGSLLTEPVSPSYVSTLRPHLCHKLISCFSGFLSLLHYDVPVSLPFHMLYLFCNLKNSFWEMDQLTLSQLMGIKHLNLLLITCNLDPGFYARDSHSSEGKKNQFWAGSSKMLRNLLLVKQSKNEILRKISSINKKLHRIAHISKTGKIGIKSVDCVNVSILVVI